MSFSDGWLNSLARVEPKRRVRAFVLGLLVDLARKNRWSIARARRATRRRRECCTTRSRRVKHRHVRDDLREFVVDHLGDPATGLVVDEAGDEGRGNRNDWNPAPVDDTASWIEHAQVAVYLSYGGPAGDAMIDRELYLPKSWRSDRQRRPLPEHPRRSSSQPNQRWLLPRFPPRARYGVLA
jgi:SRSO17 transposase